MMTYYLVNLKAKQVDSQHDTIAAAEAAAAMVKWDYHIVKPSEFEGLSMSDLAEVYNNIPGIDQKVNRFSSRAAGIQRINAHIAFPTAGKKAKKPRKTREPGAAAGRKAGWSHVELSALGKSDDLRWQRTNNRVKVYEIIKHHGKVEREVLITECEKKLGLTRPQTIGTVGKLGVRKLIKLT